jgi:MFS family permease
MISILFSITSLLFGTALLLNGMGLLGTLVGLRATAEGFSVLLVGAIMSAYFFGFVLGSWLCPTLIRTVGHIRAFAAFATLASAVAIAYPLVVDPLVWAVLRILTGLTLAGLYMVIESWLNVMAPNRLRGRLFSLYTATTLLALGTGQYLLMLGEVSGFDLFAIITILISLSLLPIVLTRIAQPVMNLAPTNLGLMRLLSISPLGVATTFTSGLVSGAFWGMGPVFGEHISADSNQVAVFMSVVIFGGALLQWPIGHISDWIDRRKVLLVVCLSASGFAAMTYPALSIDGRLAYVALFLFGGTAFTLYALGVAHVNDLLQPDEVLEATRGLLLVYGIGATLGPLLAAQFMQLFGVVQLLGFFAVSLGLLGLFSAYRLFVGRTIPMAEQGEFVPLVRTTGVVLAMSPQLNDGPVQGLSEEPLDGVKNPVV